MSSNEERVIALLLAEWQEGLRITSVPQAMSRLGLSDEEDTRWRIGQRLERAWRRRLGLRGLWRGLRWLRGAGWRGVGGWLRPLGRMPSLAIEARNWNPAVFILSNDEKLIARHILNAGRMPPPEGIGSALGLNRLAVDVGLRMLARLGFLVGAEGGYRLAPDHRLLLQGLGFNFHTVTLESGEQFNVPCAVDFLLLVSSRYRNQQVVIDDACAHCTDRIRLVFDGGEVAEVTPPETYLYRGGG